MAVIVVNKGNFDSEVLNSEIPVLLDFWAGWCGPCKMIAPILEEIASGSSNIKVCKVNVDEETGLAGKYSIMSIPTLMLIKDGNIVRRAVGAQSKAQIISMIQNV